MKVRELIAILQKYDGDLTVMVNGYEGGYSIPTAESIRQANMYDEYTHDYDYNSERPTFPAILVSRRNCVEESVVSYCGRYEAEG